MRIIIILLLLPIVLFADDIYLKTGIIVKNVIIITDSDSKYLLAETSSGEVLRFYKSDVLKVDNSEIAANDTTQNIDFDPTSIPKNSKYKLDSFQIETKTTFPNLFLLPVTALSFLLAGDYFKRSSDYKDSINEINRLYGSILTDEQKELIEDWESEKERLIIYGWSLIGIGVINLAISLKPVEVSTSGNEITISYKF